MSLADNKNSDTDSPDDSLSNLEQDVSSVDQDIEQVETQGQCKQDIEGEESRGQHDQDIKREESPRGQRDQLHCSQHINDEDKNKLPISARTVVEKKSSESEMAKLRVRDMIKLYNFATEKNQELSQAKSMYFGINKYGTHKNMKTKAMESSKCEAESGNLSSLPELINADEETEQISSVRSICEHMKRDDSIDGGGSEQLNSEMSTDNFGKSSDCAAGDPEGTASTSNNGSSYNLQCEFCRRYTRHFVSRSASNSGFRIMTSEGKSSLSRNGANQVASDENEKAYESKTTIKKTDNGVRITIDIFFDQEQNLDDIVNSRVETDIPESRIMTEFHQEANARRAYISHA